MSERNGMSAEDVVAESATAATMMVQTDAFVELVQSTLGLIGRELVASVDSGDVPGLFVPAFVNVDGKNQPGGVLALSDRAVVAWSVGMLRPKSHVAVLPYSSIDRIDHDARPETRASWGRDVLRVEADQSWTLEFVDKVFEGGTSIVPLLALVLEGAAKPVWRGPDDAVSDAESALQDPDEMNESDAAPEIVESRTSSGIPPPPSPIPPPPAPIPAPPTRADVAAPVTPMFADGSSTATPKGTDADVPGTRDAAVQILRQRLASGEIDLAEFQELLAVLRE